jgi:hypothetical protein
MAVDAYMFAVKRLEDERASAVKTTTRILQLPPKTLVFTDL